MATNAPTISSTSLTRARTELDALAPQAGAQDNAIGSLADRTAALREKHRPPHRRDPRRRRNGDRRGAGRRRPARRGRRGDQAGNRLGPRCCGRGRPTDFADRVADRRAAGPLRGLARLGRRRRRRRAVEDLRAGVGRSSRSSARPAASARKPGPALVAALVQVKEAAAHAAERAREAIETVIPESAGKAVGGDPRTRWRRSIRESVEDRLREVETVAARAVNSARAASERLTQQMLTLGQSAAALEAHVEADQQGPARKGQRGVRPPRVAADRIR